MCKCIIILSRFSQTIIWTRSLQNNYLNLFTNEEIKISYAPALNALTWIDILEGQVINIIIYKSITWRSIMIFDSKIKFFKIKWSK